MADELARVRLGSGSNVVEKNMSRVFAEMAGVTILDEPTHEPNGSQRSETGKDGRPLKERTSVDEEAKKATARSASTEKKE